MTTNEATQKLAEYHALGGFSDAAMAIREAEACGREWDWSGAQASIGRAYRLLGAEPPNATGYDWHCGAHPIQLAAQ